MSGRDGAGLGWNLVSAALPLVGSFLVSVLLAPYVGDDAWGEYSLVMSVATLALVVAKFGVHTATSRLVSENEDAPGPWIRAGLYWRGLFTFGVAAVMAAITPLVARSFDRPDVGAFWLVAPVVVSVSAFEFATEIQVGLRAFRAQLAGRIAFLAIRLGAIGVVRVFGLGIGAFLVGHALGQALPAAIVLGALLWRTRGSTSGVGTPAPTWEQARRRTWELSLPLAFGSASFLVYAHTDRLMLGWFRDTAAVGQFAVARNVLDAALFPLVAITWSLRPALTRALLSRGRATPREVLADGLRTSVLYATAGTALSAALGPALLARLYGPAYAESSDLLLWMAPLLVLRGLGAVVFPALVAADAQTGYARLMGWTALANVAANLALIPPLGAKGAILATFAALCVLTVGGLRAVGIHLGALPWRDHASRHVVAVLSSAVVAAALWWWDPATRGTPALALVSVLSAGLLLVVNLGPEVLRRRRA